MTAKQTIKDAALMILKDVCVVSRGSLICQLQSHMSSAEQGKYFFETREAIYEMVSDGTIKALTAKRANGQEQKLLMMPDVSLF